MERGRGREKQVRKRGNRGKEGCGVGEGRVTGEGETGEEEGEQGRRGEVA